jgi:hypothetical protein
VLGVAGHAAPFGWTAFRLDDGRDAISGDELGRRPAV